MTNFSDVSIKYEFIQHVRVVLEKGTSIYPKQVMSDGKTKVAAHHRDPSANKKKTIPLGVPTIKVDIYIYIFPNNVMSFNASNIENLMLGYSM